MAFRLYENVWETTTGTGTGALVFAGAVSGWRTFASQYANNDTFWYSMYDGTDFEHGIGTYASGSNSFTRSVYRSTNSNNAVNWGAGTKQVLVAPLGIALQDLLVPGSTGIPNRTGDNVWSFLASIGTSQLADDAVTMAKLANLAEATAIGRAAGAGTGDPVALSAAQLAAIIASVGGAAKTYAMNTTHDLSTTGAQSWTDGSMNFTPKGALIFQCLLNTETVSIGIIGGSSVSKVMGYIPGTGWSFNSSSLLFAAIDNANFALTAGTLTSNGVLLDWSKTGTPTNTINMFGLFWA